MRIVSWNLNKRRDCAGQAAVLRELGADVVVLQEVTERRWPNLREQLSLIGLTHSASAVELARSMDGSLRLASFVAIASRWPLLATRGAEVPAMEAIACAGIETPMGAVDVVGVHIPTSANGVTTKIETQEGLFSRISRPVRPTIVCGDFNSPKHESAEGVVTAFSGPRGERALAAELALMGRITACGLVDAFRHCQGYEADGRSWYWKNRGRTDGFRLDHIFATASLNTLACEYGHRWRESGLSDHSPIWAEIVLKPSPPPAAAGTPSPARRARGISAPWTA